MRIRISDSSDIQPSSELEEEGEENERKHSFCEFSYCEYEE